VSRGRRSREEGGWPLRDAASRLLPSRRVEEEPAPAPVLEPAPEAEAEPEAEVEGEPQAEAEADVEGEAAPEEEPEVIEEPELQPEAEAAPEPEPEPEETAPHHATGELDIPEGYGVLEGAPSGRRRAVGIVISRFNGEITNGLLKSALEALDEAGVTQDAVTVMPVPGAFELPLAAMALAKTRRYACIVALGCVIRGETPHFDYVANEAASGLQLAALETGIPISFGVLTTNTSEQAEARLEKGAEAVRTALEMADLFSQLRASAAAAVGGGR
jgi:6,7-dimethyl-8-ribityllumazine synthase